MTRSKLHARFVQVFADGKSTRAASARSVRTAEKRLGCVFPRSYVEFVSAHGSAWTPAVLTKVVDLELDHPDLQDVLSPAQAVVASRIMWRGGMSRRLVVVAGDSMGNVFCFRKLNHLLDDAEVIFFDHDFNETTAIAKGFDPLLAWYVEHCGPKRPHRKKSRRARAP